MVSSDSENVNRKLIGVGIGNVMEWFDFAVFGGLIDAIAFNFFPSQGKENKETDQILYGMIVFGVAFFMRPLGGIVLGVVGDTKGRRTGLMLSIALMLFPSFLIGCLPTFTQVGYIAPCLLILCRMLQGFAGGGEMVGAIVYIVEQTKYTGYSTFYGALCKATGNLGSTLGLGLVASLRYSLGNVRLMEYGWRIPFLVSLVFGMIGLVIRRQLVYDSDEDSMPMIQDNESQKDLSLMSQLAELRLQIFLTVAVVALWGVSYYTILVWLVYFLQNSELSGNFVLSATSVWIASLIMNVLIVLLMPFFGFLNDVLKLSPSLLLKLSSAFLMTFSCPMFLLFTINHTSAIICGYLFFTILISIYG